MEERRVRYDLKIHFVRSHFGDCFNYYTSMEKLVQLQGLRFSMENLMDLGGKPGVGSFFKCCCYVNPQIWTSEQQIYDAIYPILQSRNMFPSRGYEKKLTVELYNPPQNLIQQNHFNTFPQTISNFNTQGLPLFGIERQISPPNPFRNSDFLQESQQDTTCDVTSLEILSCIGGVQNNNQPNANNENDSNRITTNQQMSLFSYNPDNQQIFGESFQKRSDTIEQSIFSQNGLFNFINKQKAGDQTDLQNLETNNQAVQLDSFQTNPAAAEDNIFGISYKNKTDTVEQSEKYESEVFKTLKSNQEQQVNQDQDQAQNDDNNQQINQQNKDESQSHNINDQSENQYLFKQNNLFNNEVMTQQNRIQNGQIDIVNTKQQQISNTENQSSNLTSSESSNRKSESQDNYQISNQKDLNLNKQIDKQITSSAENKQEEEEEEKQNNQGFEIKSKSNYFSEDNQTSLKKQIQPCFNQMNQIFDANQNMFSNQQNNSFLDNEESEIRSQLNYTQQLDQSIDNSKLKFGQLTQLGLQDTKQNSNDPILNDTIYDDDIKKDQTEYQKEGKDLNDSDIKQQEQKQSLSIEQMKTIDMNQEKEQVYIEQSNFQIKILMKEIQSEKQKNHNLLQEQQKDKEKQRILEQNAIHYLTENSELKEQVSMLQEKLKQKQDIRFDQDLLTQSIAELKEINSEKVELIQQKQLNTDTQKDLIIEDLKQNLSEAKNEIQFLRKELQQKDEMLEILKQIQKSLLK